MEMVMMICLAFLLDHTKLNKKETLRAWVLGVGFVLFGTVFNTVLPMRAPSISIPGRLAYLLALRIGQLWAKYIPDWKVWGWKVNPGRFTKREHTLVIIMIDAGWGGIKYVPSIHTFC